MEKEENWFYFLAAKESLLSGVKNFFGRGRTSLMK